MLYQEHEAMSYFTRFVSTNPELLPTSDPDGEFTFLQKDTYVGTDAADHMVKFFITAADRIYEKLCPPPPMVMTDADVEQYELQDQCHICLKKNDTLIHIQHAHPPDEDTSSYVVTVGSTRDWVG